MEIQFQHMKGRLGTKIRRREMLDRLNAIAVFKKPLSLSAITRRPAFSLVELESELTLQKFLSIIRWAAKVIEK